MKASNIKYTLFLLVSLSLGTLLNAQEEEPRQLLLDASYFMPADNVPYLKILAREKVGRQFIPQKDIAVNVYIGEETDENLMEKVTTNEKGEARAYIPASAKGLWDSLETFNFIAVSEKTKDFEPETAELEIAKARLQIDTLTEDDTRSIVVKITQLKDGQWEPADEVDIRVLVKRSLGNLLVDTDEDFYTTDSTGTITAEYKRDSLYGDQDGDLMIIARTDDNELFGNIFAAQKVNWGVAPSLENNFHKRSLWAPRFRTPYWLLGLAYLIIGSVWGTMIYLIIQIFKLRKLGKA